MISGKVFLIFLVSFSFVFIINSAKAEYITVDAPESTDAGSSIIVEAAFYNNISIPICDATCDISGGWLTETYLMTEEGCTYRLNLSVPNIEGTYNFMVRCSKPGYETEFHTFTLSVSSKTSYLSVSIIPSTPRSDELVKVNVYFNDVYGVPIPRGECDGKWYINGIVRGSLSLESTGSYFFDVFPVSEPGEYSVMVSCSAPGYESKSLRKSFTVTKRSSSLTLFPLSLIRFGDKVEIRAQYNSGYTFIPGSCTLILKDGLTVLSNQSMKRGDNAYIGSVIIPFRKGNYKIEVRCMSSKYEDQFKSVSILPHNRDVVLDIVSPLYPLVMADKEVELAVSLKDAYTRKDVTGFSCYATIGENIYTLKYERDAYRYNFGRLRVGIYPVVVRCSKDFYNDGEEKFIITVVPVPINVSIVESAGEHGVKENITMKVVVESLGRWIGTQCAGKVEKYDVFGRVYEREDVSFERTEYYYEGVVSGERPGRVYVNVTCGDDIYLKTSANATYIIRLMERESEEKTVTYLGIITMILLVLIVLFKKKLKIIS